MTRRKIFGLVLGLFLLVGSGVVVGLTVVRLQNQKATVSQPKADCQAAPGCCNQIASGGGFDKCGWSDRGWCTPSQCDGSDSSKTYDCNRNGGPRNCNCGLLNKTYCAAPPPTGGSGTSFTATYPTSGVMVSSLTPTFTWTATTTGLSYNCLNVHTDQCQTPIPSLSHCPSLSDRSWTETAALSPNTTYYWVIYGQPGWPAPGSGCQSFKTGAAVVTPLPTPTPTPTPPPTPTGEVDTCWGNEGGNGRCYDCNGDGAINILDFSCFAKKWLQNV